VVLTHGTIMLGVQLCDRPLLQLPAQQCGIPNRCCKHAFLKLSEGILIVTLMVRQQLTLTAEQFFP